MAARPMATTVGGAPPGGVVGLSLSFPPWIHYAVAFVSGSGAGSVAWLLDVFDISLQVLDFAL